ncbi:MAG: metallophosphoesterase [Fimbriimonadaceae bacterium]|nr:metallophosphoesterase [Fimbriimonadaceae bacterium]
MKSLLWALAVVLMGCGGSSTQPAPKTKVHPHPNLLNKALASPSDPLLATYAFIGCNRISASDQSKDPLANGSTANVPQLKQTFTDLVNSTLVPIKPNYLFNAGDIVDNEAIDDGTTLQTQLNAWASAFKSLIPVPMIGIPGNHEMLQSTGGGEPGEFPNPPTQAIWQSWVTTNGFNANSGNGPTPTSYPADNLMFDDSKMSYSFDQSFTIGGQSMKIHFVIVNTDTQNTVTSPLNSNYKTAAWIPLNWIKADITAAAADSQTKAIIMMGHRPLTGVPNAGELPVDPGLSSQLVTFLAGQPKFACYLAAHAHLWTSNPITSGTTTIQQFVVGNAGSELESNWFAGTPAPPQWQAMGAPYYGFTVLTVRQSGNIGLYHVWRPANADRKKYYLPGPTMVSQATQEVVVFDMTP